MSFPPPYQGHLDPSLSLPPIQLNPPTRPYHHSSEDYSSTPPLSLPPSSENNISSPNSSPRPTKSTPKSRLSKRSAPTSSSSSSSPRATAASGSRHPSHMAVDEVSEIGEGEEDEDGDEEAQAEAKRRRIARACDLCRRKKVKCDAWEGGRNGHCSNCQDVNLRCTYVEQAKRRGPPPGYLETLEWKLRRLTDVIEHISPDLNLSREIGPPIQRETFNLAIWKQQTSALGIDVEREIRTGTGNGRGKGRAVGSGRNSGLNQEIIQIDTIDGREKSITSNGSGGGGGGSPISNQHHRSNHTTSTSTDAANIASLKASLGPKDSPPGIFNSDGTLTIGVMSARAMTNDEAVNAMGGESVSVKIKEEEKQSEHLNRQMSDVSLEGYRYHGKASGVQLLRTVMDYKFADNSEDVPPANRYLTALVSGRRKTFWSVPTWEANVANGSVNNIDLSQWPEPDLARKLIDAYFENDHRFLPLFNRPIFERDYDCERWRVDPNWAKVCLLLFANAARLVDDPRVYWHAKDPKKERDAMLDFEVYRHSAGWRWMEMMIKAGKNILAPSVLEDLQLHVLLASFLLRSAVLHIVYAVVGNGLRTAQDMGIHTKLSSSRFEDRAQAELHNRAFWALIWLDRIVCAGMGRTITLRDEDFDVDYPLAVDDQYWNTGDPSRDFIQPSDQPSQVSYFVNSLKLLRVVEHVLQKVYSVSGNDERLNDLQAQKMLVAQLDSDLYAWLEKVPQHLRWDINREDSVFFEQSCLLYSLYYFCQILIHRPFIPSPKQQDGLNTAGGFPSLAICTNAARSCSHVIDAHNQRCIPNITMMLPAFTSAVVLLIGVWGGKKTGIGESTSAANLADVRKCLNCMKQGEQAWRAAGRLRDVVMELANLSETSLSTPSPAPSSAPPSQKRQRGGDESISQHSSNVPSPTNPDVGLERQVRSLPLPRGMGAPTMATLSAVRSGPAEGNTSQNPSNPSQPWFMQNAAGPSGQGYTAQRPVTPLTGAWGAPSATRTGMTPYIDMMNGAGTIIPPGPMSPSIERLLNMPQYDTLTGASSGTDTFGTNGYSGMGGVSGYSPAPTQQQQSDLSAPSFASSGSMSWPFGSFDNAGAASASMGDLWSAVPNSFEADAWISYLQGMPMGAEYGQNSQPQQPQQHYEQHHQQQSYQQNGMF